MKNLPKFENFTGSTMTNKNINEQEVFGDILFFEDKYFG